MKIPVEMWTQGKRHIIGRMVREKFHGPCDKPEVLISFFVIDLTAFCTRQMLLYYSGGALDHT